MNPAIGIALVLGLLLALLGGLRWYRDRTGAHPELIRKLLHVGMGTVCLSFPWIFLTVAPVAVLGAVAIALFVCLRCSEKLRRLLGGALYGVERTSWGEVYFALSVLILFALAHERPVLYCIPLLVLTLGDALAALVGVTYGRHRYVTAGNMKSLEGSAALFGVAFVSVHVPLLLGTGIGRAESLLAAATLGLLAVLLEAIAWGGLDNMLVPLGSYVLLRSYLGMSVAELTSHLLAVLGLVTALLCWRRRTTLDDGAILAAAVGFYIAWAVGGWEWLIAPAGVMLGYPLFSPWTEADRQRSIEVGALLSVASSGLFWLFLGQVYHDSRLLYPYTVSFAAHLAIIGTVRLDETGVNLQPLARIGIGLMKGWLLVLLPFGLLQGGAWILLSLLGLAATAVVVPVFMRLEHGFPGQSRSTPRWAWQGVCAFGASLPAAMLVGLPGGFLP